MATLPPIDDLSAEIVTDSSLRELASGFDSFYLSGHGEVSTGLIAELENGKELAHGTGIRIPHDIGGHEFGLAGHGRLKYRFNLRHRNGLVGITAGTRLPVVRVQPFAEFLHSSGVEEAIEWFRGVLSALVSGSLTAASQEAKRSTPRTTNTLYHTFPPRPGRHQTTAWTKSNTGMSRLRLPSSLWSKPPMPKQLPCTVGARTCGQRHHRVPRRRLRLVDSTATLPAGAQFAGIDRRRLPEPPCVDQLEGSPASSAQPRTTAPDIWGERRPASTASL
jgi:hypothetical protein